MTRRLGFACLFSLSLLACGSADSSAGNGSTARAKDNTAPSGAAEGSTTGDGTPPAGRPTTDLHFSTFGDKNNPAVVFLHGGPGASSIGFEVAAAALLAAQGFFVVAYDQRGCGRSPRGTLADYSYKGATADLSALIRALALKSPPVLLPHSFGGSIALKFMEIHPNEAKGVVMIGSPINFPQTYFTILEHSVSVYQTRFNRPKANETRALQTKMFPRGLVPPFDYDADDIVSAVENMNSASLVFPSRPSFEAMKVFAKMQLAPDRDLANAINPDLGQGFQTNDKVGYADFTPLLEELKTMVYGIYGDEDRIFEAEELNRLSTILGPSHFITLSASSHFSYVDQPTAFVEAATRHIKELVKR